MKHLLVASLLTLGPSFAAAAAAQDSVSVSYQYLNLAASGLGNHTPLGFAIDYAHEFKGWHLVGNVDWSRDSDTAEAFRLEPFLAPVTLDVALTMTTFSAGPRWSRLDAEGAGVYGEVLAGVTRTTSSSNDGRMSQSDYTTDFMIQPGIGFAVPFAETWRIIGGIDYRRVFSEGDRDIGLRLFAGVRRNLK